MTTQAPVDLKEELARRRLTQTEVARRMHIGRHYLCNILAGRKVWTRRTARDFAFATGIPLDAILPNGQEPKA